MSPMCHDSKLGLTRRGLLRRLGGGIGVIATAGWTADSWAQRLLAQASSSSQGVSPEVHDWPEYRGRGRLGLWTETGIVDRFPEGGLPVLWRTPHTKAIGRRLDRIPNYSESRPEYRQGE